MRIKIKICGITSIEDAEACASLGADMIGLNFVPSSPRCISAGAARRIADAVRGRVEIVGVVADLDEAALIDLAKEASLDRLQLHGDEPPELVQRLAPRAFKAVRIGDADDVERARRYEGLLLVDAKVRGALGGTGHPVDLALAAPLARERDVLLAGGLGPANVADAIRAVSPWGVDVASGVEIAPGIKDLSLCEAFVQAARSAAKNRY